MTLRIIVSKTTFSHDFILSCRKGFVRNILADYAACAMSFLYFVAVFRGDGFLRLAGGFPMPRMNDPT